MFTAQALIPQTAEAPFDFGGAAGREKFAAALADHLNGCIKVHNDYCERNGYTDPKIHNSLNFSSWRLDFGQKRVRIVHDGSARSFIDYATGDVLKSASWKTPAKHARGNIYDADKGCKNMGPHGPAYLR